MISEVNPEMIVLARETRGLTQQDLADKLNRRARDCNRTNPEHQLFIPSVCQNYVVKSERAKVRAGFAYFFTVSTCRNKYKSFVRKISKFK